ncbi:mycothiol-dependent nitroreductase Rv2466c family protein [Saccharothrix variisporea]|uniref:DSBA-like thioredoxin domain-containing protein n=1 Tax=Saccharothrix variisporea TaxID=543527 RepID=A0A495XP77_9PSEU|nr:hypothetical protein [Saccharothrix variisporea]RKT74704.1 hypothetical protein DFJ66_8071 [Saccharothrix variisporea]
MTGGTRDRVDFWFDPLCGWTWLAARWLVEAAAVRPLEITWHPMGLSVLNGGLEEVPAERQRLHEPAKRLARVAAAVRERCGPEVVGPFYTALGSRLHEPGGLFGPMRTASDEELTDVRLALLDRVGPVVDAALAEVGLPADLVTAKDEPEWDDWLRASHERVPAGRYRRRVVGAPTLSLNGGPAVWGPVVAEVVRGERAVRLWDAFRVLVAEEAFFELKRAVVRPSLREFPQG